MSSYLHDLAKLLSTAPQDSPVTPSLSLTMSRGEVLSIGTGGDIVIDLDDSGVSVTASKLDSYTATVGDAVECLCYGTRVLVLGVVG